MRDSGKHANVTPVAVVGRYAMFDRIASGGMATVHFGRLLGSSGFLRTVAIKRLHPQFAHDQDFTSMLLDEARLVSRIQHPNVVPTLDVVAEGEELLLVMEYLRGVSLDRLIRSAGERHRRPTPGVAVAIVTNMLSGLHAAHEARDERRMPLGLVHRDVSPHNVLVGTDGVSRVLDFGIAKAEGRSSTTREGQLKGKIRYMAPEQITGTITRAVDVYAAGIVLFEALTSERMFGAAQEVEAAYQILEHRLRVPSQIDPSLAPFDAVFRRATAASAADRYPTAKQMADDLERVVSPASPDEVGSWVEELANDLLEEHAEIVARIERSTTASKIPIALESARGLPLAAPSSRSNNDVITDETITSASVASRELVVPLERGRFRFAIAAAALALIGALVMFTLPRGSSSREMRATSEKDTTLSAAAPVGTTANTGPPETPAQSASAQAPSPPPATSTAAAPPIAPAKSASVAATAEASARRSPAPARAGTPAKPHCDPPFTVDAQGHRHFLLECVK